MIASWLLFECDLYRSLSLLFDANNSCSTILAVALISFGTSVLTVSMPMAYFIPSQTPQPKHTHTYTYNNPMQGDILLLVLRQNQT